MDQSNPISGRCGCSTYDLTYRWVSCRRDLRTRDQDNIGADHNDTAAQIFEQRYAARHWLPNPPPEPAPPTFNNITYPSVHRVERDYMYQLPAWYSMPHKMIGIIREQVRSLICLTLETFKKAHSPLTVLHLSSCATRPNRSGVEVEARLPLLT